jgi:hypothetical protein
MSLVKTPVAARMLGRRGPHLLNLIYQGYIPSPQKDSSGDYLWGEDDVERARVYFATRGRKPQSRMPEVACD